MRAAAVLGAACMLAVACGGGMEQMTEAMDRGRQRRTMADMRDMATANRVLRVDTGRYAAKLEDLLAAGTLEVVPTVDGWGNAWIYTTTGADSYSITSLRSDGNPGPPPPSVWPDAPYEPDIILMEDQFIQAPTGR